MRNLVIILIVGILLLAGCSSGKNPIMPDGQSGIPGSIDNIPVMGLTMSDDGSFNALGMMGAYELRIDPVNVTAELVSKRSPSLGESMIVSGIKFFTMVPCHDCLKVNSVALTADGYLALTFGVKHPFEAGDPSKPPSGKNRLDLDIFDLALVIKPLGATPKHFALIGADAYTGILVNNAGYTVELLNVVSDPAALPYALAIDDSKSASNTFNKFAMGADAAFDVNFDPAGITSLNFDLYLTMGYG